MKRKIAVKLAAPAAALLLGGCVTVPKDAGFSDVSAASKDRTGHAVSWTRGAGEDAAADALTRTLLVDPLTVDRAVQVALLNNRTLQANFENLGIARGQLINASLFANPVIGFDVWAYGGATTVEALLSEDLTSILYQPLRVGLYGGEFEATKRLVTAQIVALVGNVRRAFYHYQADQQLVDMFTRTVQATEASYLVAARMREAGGMRQLDVLQERALYEQAKIDLNAAVEHLSQSRESLNALMGLWGGQLTWAAPARLPDLPIVEAVAGTETEANPTEAVTSAEYPKKFPPMKRMVKPQGIPIGAKPGMKMNGMTPPPPTAEGRAEGLAGPPVNGDLTGAAPATQPYGGASAERFAAVERAAVANNLDLEASRAFITAQAYRLKLDVANAVVPFANVGLDSDKERNEGTWGLGPGGAVKVPLFDWGQGVYPRETSRLRKRVEEYAALATNVRAAARAAEARLQATRARALYYRDVILPLRAAVTAESQLQYNAMQLGQFDLLLNKRLQIQAGALYIAAVRDYWVARADVEQIVGGSLPAGGVGAMGGMGGGPMIGTTGIGMGGN